MSLDIEIDIEIYDIGMNTDQEFTIYQSSVSANAVPIWRKTGIEKAFYDAYGELCIDLIPQLQETVCQMVTNEEEFRALIDDKYQQNTYQHALEFARSLLRICKQNPRALIKSIQ